MTDSQPQKFSELGLATEVLEAVEAAGYEAPSPIQAAAIPPLLAGRDLIGQAQTGTGKTAAFALPLLSRLDLDRLEPQVLVLTPTRELALQVAEAMQSYARRLEGFHVLPVYGGQSMHTQLRQLKRGVHVVVGTPGRVQDHLRRGTLRLQGLEAVVLDEADEMLRMGFLEEVESILEHTPEEKQVALFSATMPAAIARVAKTYLQEPVEIAVEARTATVETIRQRYWKVVGTGKLEALTRILEVEDFDAMLVFVRTKVAAAELAEKLEARGFASGALNGDMNQAMRERTVQRLKSGVLDIVVATDVAARGLDVERITHVINFDIPYDTEAYVHRIGRTGRAGRTGEAILFVSPRERRLLLAIERATGQRIEKMLLPSQSDVADYRIRRFKQLITETLAEEDLDRFEEIVRDYVEEQAIEWQSVAAALAFLAQRDRPVHRAPDDRSRRETPSSNSDPRSETARKRHDQRRPERQDREPRGSRAAVEPGMERFRVEVGRSHGVEVRNLVGAIANEAGLDAKHIGQIRLFEEFSLVDLPEGMPKEIQQLLGRVWVCDRQLKIRLDDGGSGRRQANAPRTERGSQRRFGGGDDRRPRSHSSDRDRRGGSSGRRGSSTEEESRGRGSKKRSFRKGPGGPGGFAKFRKKPRKGGPKKR